MSNRRLRIAQLNMNKRNESFSHLAALMHQERVNMAFLQEPPQKIDNVHLKVYTHRQNAKSRGQVAMAKGPGAVAHEILDLSLNRDIMAVRLPLYGITLLNIYCQPLENVKRDIEKFEAYMTEIQNIVAMSETNLVIFMDANAKHLNWHSGVANNIACRKGKILQEVMTKHKFSRATLKDTPTYRYKGAGAQDSFSTIDLCFHSGDVKIKQVRWVDTTGFSDHNMIVFDIDLPPQKRISFPVWNKADTKAIENVISNCQGSINQLENISQKFETTTYCLKKIQDNLIPVKNVAANRVCPWWDESIELALTTTKKLSKYVIKYSSEPSPPVPIENANKRKQEITQHLKNEITQKRNRYSNDILKDSSKFWKLINGEKESKMLIVGASEMYEYLQQSFNEHPTPTFAPLHAQPKTATGVSYTTFEVKKLISSLKNVARGPDGIYSKFLKTFNCSITPIVTHLINDMFIKRTFPDMGQIASIKAIRKPKADSNLPLKKRCRAIAIFSHLAKLLEKAFFTSLKKIISEPDIGSQATESLLAQFWERVKQNENNNRCQYAIFLDIEAAFNAACHEPIYKQLVKLGCDDLHLDIYKSYNSRRMLEWYDDKGKCQHHKLSRGTYQGAIMASFGFTLFMREFKERFLSRISQNVYFSSYVDDVVIVVDAESDPQAQCLMAEALKFSKEIATEMGIGIAENKTQILDLNKTKNPLWGDLQKYRTTQATLLGLTFNEIKSIQFNHHMTTLGKEVCKEIDAFEQRFSNQYGRNPLFWQLLWKQKWEPKLLYAAPVWGQDLLKKENVDQDVSYRNMRRCHQKTLEFITKAAKGTRYETLLMLAGELSLKEKIRLASIREHIQREDLEKVRELLQEDFICTDTKRKIDRMYTLSEGVEDERTWVHVNAIKVTNHLGVAWVCRRSNDTATTHSFTGPAQWNWKIGVLYGIKKAIESANEKEILTISVNRLVLEILQSENALFQGHLNEINDVILRRNVYVNFVPSGSGNLQNLLDGDDCREAAATEAAQQHQSSVEVRYLSKKQLKEVAFQHLFNAQRDEWLANETMARTSYSTQCAREFLTKDTITPLTSKKKFHATITKFITGNGVIFQQYAQKIGSSRHLPRHKCFCQKTDTPRHRLLECEEFSEERSTFLTSVRKRNVTMNQLASMAKIHNNSLIQFMLAIQNKHFNIEKKRNAAPKDDNNTQKLRDAERYSRYQKAIRKAGIKRMTPHYDHSYARPSNSSEPYEHPRNRSIDEGAIIESTPQSNFLITKSSHMVQDPTQRPDSDPPDPP